jgi:hypothetical protein
MKLEKRISAIEEAFERGGDDGLRIVMFYKDDSPEVREAILKEARERLPKKRRRMEGEPDLMIINFGSNRGDFVRRRPPGIEEGDKQ